jgi:ankyrin repeat protein
VLCCPLTRFQKEGHHEVVSCLLQHGACDVSNQNGSTALTFAAEKARSAVVEVMLKHNADVNARTNKRGITPLIFAVKARDIKTAMLLLTHGADVNAQTLRTKYTALIAAIRNKDEVCCSLILAHCHVAYHACLHRK